MAARNSNPSIFSAYARLDDPDALTRLLEPVPDAGSVRESLASGAPGFGQVWDGETSRDYWIAWDAETVACFTLAGMTLMQSASVRLRFDEIRTPETVLNVQLLAALMAAELGVNIELLS